LRSVNKRIFAQILEEIKMEILKVILLAVVLVAVAIAGMAIKILFKKGGKFPNTHVSGNRHLKQNGVYCAQTQDRVEQRNAWRKVDFKNLKLKQEKN
jgi:hypothetical protein